MQTIYFVTSKVCNYYHIKSGTAGVIYVITMDLQNAPQLIEHIHENLDYVPLGCSWIPQSASFAVVGETLKRQGILEIKELDNGKLQVKKKIITPSCIKCVKTCESSSGIQCLITGEVDGNISLRDVTRPFQNIWSPCDHSESITCIDVCGISSNNKYGPLEVVTGCRDGTVKLWDIRQPKEVTIAKRTILQLKPVDNAIAECWTVAFGNCYSESDRCIAAGFDNGDVKLFDLRSSTMILEENIQNGVCHLQFDRKYIQMNKLACATLEGFLHVFDLRTFHPEDGYAKLKHKDEAATLWSCNFLPQNREICAIASGTGQVSIYKYSYPTKRVLVDPSTGLNRGVAGTMELLNKKILSPQPIVGFDWHPNKIGLAAFTSIDHSIQVILVTKLHLY
ncbi:putative WD repeat-containing protein 92 [Cardiosporidium cionae]|uniref:WD repeat-containing protein 92 n=1 Tax=Cardiosporidium cionae TaxID=476202 RepID=A0ABQ7J663_9APIC|nr:putative WD repeat-containing protein 92 [Cardiosporidium cionae]|eukprot:KAF8819473.1 putative WD repeat-containing protein 92 [Cardiosporidium cionae]